MNHAENDGNKPHGDYGPARAGAQEYAWQRNSLLAGTPWTCAELPRLDGSEQWESNKTTAARLRSAIAAVMADGAHRRDLQVLEQRAHLVESSEEDANIPWHRKSLDTSAHQLAFWLLHAGARLAERRAGGFQAALRAAGRTLRLLHADRRIRTAVDRSDLVIAALAFAAAGAVAEAAECVAGLRGPSPVDSALISLLSGDVASARRAAQGVMVRAGRNSLHASFAETVQPIVASILNAEFSELESARARLGVIRENAAAEQDAWTWWRARLLRLVAGNLPHRVPAAALAGPVGADAARRIGRALQQVNAAGLGYTDEQVCAALLAIVTKPSVIVRSAALRSRRSAILTSLLDFDREGVAALVTPTKSEGRAWVARLRGRHSSVMTGRVIAADGASRAIRAGDIVVGDAIDVKAALFESVVELSSLTVTGLVDGIDDRSIVAELALEILLQLARHSSARCLLTTGKDANAEATNRWWGKDAAVHTLDAPTSLRRGVLFIAEGRCRLAWRDAIGTLQPSWVESTDIAARGTRFPTGRNEAVGAAAMRFSRLGPVIVVCATPDALSEVLAGATTAAELRESVLRRHDWPHDALQRFERAAREHGLHDKRLIAAQHGFLSWSRTDHPALQRSTEALLAAASARVAVVDLALPVEHLSACSSVLFTAPAAGAERLDAVQAGEYARLAGIPGVDRQGMVLIAVDGRRARQQVVRDLTEADRLLEHLETATLTSGVLWAATEIASTTATDHMSQTAALIRDATADEDLDITKIRAVLLAETTSVDLATSITETLRSVRGESAPAATVSAD